jgi:hypothetical protein
MTRRMLIPIAAASLLLALGPGAAVADGRPANAFYVDGTVYRTVAAPNDLSRTGAPADTFDALYAVEGQDLAVAAAAPGDPDYNGGRWMRFPVTWNIPEDQRYPLTSEEEVLAAASGPDPDVTIASEPDAQFTCPVIPA